MISRRREGTFDSALFSLAPEIRCCIIFGRDGKRLRVDSRFGGTLEPDRDTELVLDFAALFMNRNRDPGRYHGKIACLTAMSEWTTLLAYQMTDKLALVAADPDFPLEKTKELGNLLERQYYWLGEPAPAPEFVAKEVE